MTRKYILLFTFFYVTIGMSLFPRMKSYFNLNVVSYRKYFHFACFIFCAPSYIFSVFFIKNYSPI